MRHKRTALIPLTDEERRFATENHYMIKDFLKYHRLQENDWYDVVVFRYLHTVQNWFRRPELHRYPFVSIARRAMWSAVYNEKNKQNRRIRTVSLDGTVQGTENLRLIDTITEENLNFVIYVGGEEMKVSYDVIVPERRRGGVGTKSDETIAIESFLQTRKMKNMRIEYDTVEEAKRKIPTIRTYRNKNKLQEVIDVFRDDKNIYVVRIQKEGK